MHRFFAEPERFSSGAVYLDADETRHLRDVLRLKPGVVVQVFDGVGNEFLCEVNTISKKAAELSILEKLQPASPESPLELTLAATMLKGEKFDLVVQKAVELGVHRLVPIRTGRTDVRSKDSATRVIRWRKIAL